MLAAGLDWARTSGRSSLRDRIARMLGGGSLPGEDRRRLQQRVDHLETLVEGLQDAIHRDTVRPEQRMAELERRTHRDELAKALSDDARRRGI
jgi:hypothetical protein